MDTVRRTTVSKVIHAPCDTIYRAFLDPRAVATWLPPGSMRGVIHAFEAREGGCFSMSLVYADDEASGSGKTTDSTDTFEGYFAKLIRNELVVWATRFQSPDPAFAGEMTVSTTLLQVDAGTRVTIVCASIPSGIRLEDNEAGCRSTLEKLAAFVSG
jgi:uncharacterized protein YndB with AHSA1/START domain